MFGRISPLEVTITILFEEVIMLQKDEGTEQASIREAVNTLILEQKIFDKIKSESKEKEPHENEN